MSQSLSVGGSDKSSSAFGSSSSSGSAGVSPEDSTSAANGAEWWTTPKSEYVKLGAVDPAIFGLDISDVGGDVANVEQAKAAPPQASSSMFVGQTMQAGTGAASSVPMKGLPRVRHSDENPIDWSNQRHAPPQPVRSLDLNVGEAPKPANDISTQARPPMPRHHGDPSDRPIPFQPEPDLDRHRYWSAFRSAATHAQLHHDDMGIRLIRMKSAQHDTQLGALGFDVERGWEGDLATLTEKQHVPLKNGATVGSLFGKDNNLKLDKHDQAAIKTGANAVDRGKGGEDGIQMRGLETQRADERLHAANEGVKKEFHALDGARARLERAILAIETFELQGKADDVRAEIQSLRDETGSAREIVELLSNIASGVAFALSGEVGDAIDKAGAIAATLIGHLNDGKIDRAVAKLTKLEKKVKTTEAQGLMAELTGTRADVEAAKAGVKQSGAFLQSALTDRRIAYNKLALTTGSHLPCPESSREKISGILAAIPLVEIVVSKARGLNEACSPPIYSEMAGRGLGMAKANGFPVADTFLRACGELAHVKLYANTIEGDWTQRLNALITVKQQILGQRPGED